MFFLWFFLEKTKENLRFFLGTHERLPGTGPSTWANSCTQGQGSAQMDFKEKGLYPMVY